jgi:hypothetical protein
VLLTKQEQRIKKNKENKENKEKQRNNKTKQIVSYNILTTAYPI